MLAKIDCGAIIGVGVGSRRWCAPIPLGRGVRLPRVLDEVLHCAVYLYPSASDAEKSVAIGGSGFIIGIKSPYGYFNYFVTNRHVIEDGSVIVRINKRSGGFLILEPTEKDWIVSPFDDDLAVCPVTFGESIGEFEIRSINREIFLTKDILTEFEIGPGDDTFMVGRFVSHEGVERNLPTIRFGNIAQMPIEPIVHHWGYKEVKQESFLVEARSIPGYSGSPVFVHIPTMSNRPSRPELVSRELGTWFLGVDWCHLNDHMPAHDKSGKELPFTVIANSGLMGVIPAWRLDALLDCPQVKDARDECIAMMEKKVGTRSVTPTSSKPIETTAAL